MKSKTLGLLFAGFQPLLLMPAATQAMVIRVDDFTVIADASCAVIERLQRRNQDTKQAGLK
jgi:hypothetical protein